MRKVGRDEVQSRRESGCPSWAFGGVMRTPLSSDSQKSTHGHCFDCADFQSSVSIPEKPQFSSAIS